jgi:hypothetical protein
MVDNPNGLDPNVPPVPVTVEEEAPKNFLASTTGKIVIGVVALVVLLAVIGALLYIFLFSAPTTVVTNVVPPKPGGVVPTSSVSPTATAPIVEPGQRPLSSTFTFRNIFAPTMAEPVPAVETTSGTDSTTTTTTPNIPDDTLYLASIQTTNGEPSATFIWNKGTYILFEGDSIPNTPWQLVQINTSSVVMLYGDTQVTLSLGQALTK